MLPASEENLALTTVRGHYSSLRRLKTHLFADISALTFHRVLVSHRLLFQELLIDGLSSDLLEAIPAALADLKTLELQVHAMNCWIESFLDGVEPSFPQLIRLEIRHAGGELLRPRQIFHLEQET